MAEEEVTVHWFRRDLRFHDNTALEAALSEGLPVLLLFIFDTRILEDLDDPRDARVHFIHSQLEALQKKAREFGGGLRVEYGDPLKVWENLVKDHSIHSVHFNEDYEPYAIERDAAVLNLLSRNGSECNIHKDHVLFGPKEVLKKDGSPYTVYTPYSKKALALLKDHDLVPKGKGPGEGVLLKPTKDGCPSLSQIGFEASSIEFPPSRIPEDVIRNYSENRDLPAMEGTSRLSVHLRFGTVSIREVARVGKDLDPKFLSELLWRDFFQMILFHFPHVVTRSFKPAFDRIPWRNDPDEFRAWCEGKTGYPIVDAGMRELNLTGYMHNRLRMITASFLTKHLLVDWRWGESYFARKLLDYELGSNNGGWQWAAGSGCDAAPYFRIFNPYRQQERFDPHWEYIRKWVPEVDTDQYPEPIVEHGAARDRALMTLKVEKG